MIRYHFEAGKKFSVLARVSEFGKTRVLLECPHCDAQFWAYVWSISGGGKKCEGCGAIHHRSGNAYPVVGAA